jgi:hypothetical protein
MPARSITQNDFFDAFPSAVTAQPKAQKSARGRVQTCLCCKRAPSGTSAQNSILTRCGLQETMPKGLSLGKLIGIVAFGVSVMYVLMIAIEYLEPKSTKMRPAQD